MAIDHKRDQPDKNKKASKRYSKPKLEMSIKLRKWPQNTKSQFQRSILTRWTSKMAFLNIRIWINKLINIIGREIMRWRRCLKRNGIIDFNILICIDILLIWFCRLSLMLRRRGILGSSRFLMRYRRRCSLSRCRRRKAGRNQMETRRINIRATTSQGWKSMENRLPWTEIYLKKNKSIASSHRCLT